MLSEDMQKPTYMYMLLLLEHLFLKVPEYDQHSSANGVVVEKHCKTDITQPDVFKRSLAPFELLAFCCKCCSLPVVGFLLNI